MEVSRRRAPPRPPRPAAPLPLLAYLLALAAPGRGADEPVWRSEQAIGAIAASRADGVFVASGSCLDQLDYSLQHRLSRLYRDRAGNCTEPVSLAPPARPRPGSSFSKLLLPYREGAADPGGLLLTGWTFDRGACEVRPLSNLSLSSLRNGTEVVSCHPQGSTAGVVYRAGNGWYLAVAATYVLPEPETASRCNPAASDRDTAIAIKDTEGRSLATKELGRLKLSGAAGSLHFVDAFLWNGSVYFPYYRYNYTSGVATGPPSMARIAQSTVVQFQGQAALVCGRGRHLLLSSSLVEALGVWAGVFSAATEEGPARRSPATTALCLFRMSEIQARAKSCNWDFEPTEHDCVSPGPAGRRPERSQLGVRRPGGTGGGGMPQVRDSRGRWPPHDHSEARKRLPQGSVRGALDRARVRVPSRVTASRCRRRLLPKRGRFWDGAAPCSPTPSGLQSRPQVCGLSRMLAAFDPFPQHGYHAQCLGQKKPLTPED